MPAYIIGEIEITDPETYKRYTAQTPAVIGKFGGRFIVRGGNGEAVEGAAPKASSAAEFGEVIRSDIAKWRNVVRAAGISAD